LNEPSQHNQNKQPSNTATKQIKGSGSLTILGGYPTFSYSDVLTRKRKAQLYLLFSLLFLAGFVGTFLRNKPITVVIDGVYTQKATNHFLNFGLISRLSQDIHAAEFKVLNEEELNLLVQDDQIVRISTLKTIEATINGEVNVYQTYADTLAQFLEERADQLADLGDEYSYRVQDVSEQDKESFLLYDGQVLQIDIIRQVKKEVTRTTAFKTEYRDNNSLPLGSTNVIQQGIDREFIQEVTTTYVNGEKDSTTRETIKVLVEGQDRIIERGTRVTGSVQPTDSVWDELAQCESGGNWHINTGNGFFGGLQFAQSTWNAWSARAGVSAARADLATREEQIKVATLYQSVAGWNPWPACTLRLGLRN